MKRKLNVLTLALLLCGAGNLAHAATQDAASQMPDISNKKVLLGYWHNWPGTRDNLGYLGGLPSSISLREVPAEFNVVSVAFMKVFDGQDGNIPTFKPYNATDEEFRAQVAELNAQGRPVLISLGGAEAHILLHKGQEQALADEIIRLVEVYGFDGLDIDLEQSAITAGDNSSVIPAALKMVRAHYQQQGKHFIISMAPEFPYLTTEGAYKPYLQNLEGVYDFIAPQYYNQNGAGVDMNTEEHAQVGVWYLTQNDDARKEHFLFYLTDSLANGTRGFTKIPANKLVIGLPTNNDAAANGYVKDPQAVYNALARLTTAGEPIKGLMTWSVNWDNGKNKAGQSYGYEFANRYRNTLDTLPDVEAPSIVTGITHNQQNNSVILNWQPSSDNVGVVGYTIWRDGMQVGTSMTTAWVDNNIQHHQPNDVVYQYWITAKDAAGNESPASQSVAVVVKPNGPANQAPIAHAGVDQTVQSNASVTLDASGSTDPDNDVLSYEWKQTSGPTVNFVANRVTTTFVAPQVNSDTTLTFSVTVKDKEFSATASTRVLVKAKVEEPGNGGDTGATTAFKAGTAYGKGDKVSYNGKVYRCLQSHVGANHWAPDAAVSLWVAE